MAEQLAYGMIHCHTEHSLKDSQLTISAFVKKAEEMGVKYLSLTDHGTGTGLVEFIEICQSRGIMPIPGFEGYIKNEEGRRNHILILARNYKGYQNVCKAITMSNENLDIKKTGNKSTVYPLLTKDILLECFKDGNCFITSACVNGILADILLHNTRCDREIEKLKKSIEKHISEKEQNDYKELKKELEEKDKYIEELTEKRDSYTELAKKKYANRKKGLELIKNSDPEKYRMLTDEIDREIASSDEAKEKLPAIKNELANTKKSRTVLNKKVMQYEVKLSKLLKTEEKIKEVSSRKTTEEALIKKCENEMLWYKSHFGSSFLVEVQYHRMPDEAYVYPVLSSLAHRHSVPVIATNDSHMADREDAEARQFIKSMRFNKWEENDVADYELYMKSDKELHDILCEILPEDTVKSALNNIKVLCNSCHFEYPDVKHYPKYIDETGHIPEDSSELLRKQTMEGAKRLYGELSREYLDQINYELDIIINMGFADYLLIVADYIKEGKRLSKANNEYGIGYGVGPGRGSAVGSIVCNCLGITALDPIRYNLKFERFLNKDRVTMPDIDVDFSIEVREKVIEYVKNKYGADSVALVRTVGKQKARAVVRTVARLLGAKEKNDTTAYYSYGDRIAKAIPNTPNIKLSDCQKELEEFQHPIEKRIIQYSYKIEGCITNLGSHAAGVIIGDGNPLSSYVPLLYNTELGKWTVQCDKEEAERIGLLKMDFLGLRNLDIITDCIRRIKRSTGIEIDIENIPFEDEVFANIFANGNTKSVFQCESAGMRGMFKKLKPQNIEDVILGIAVYRPGPVDSIPDIISSKNGQKKPYYCIPELEKILSPTYGYPIYQEQLMDIFSVGAGFSQSEADTIRRYMSKKKTDKFIASKPQFIQGITDHGASREDAEELWDSLVEFSKYAFNKSHAAAYAMITYKTAYLKYHYPEYYMCSVLNYTEGKKLSEVLFECSEMNINIIAPNVNASGTMFENCEKGIMYGLSKIKTVKSQASSIIAEKEKNGIFTGFTNFIARTSCKKDVMEALIKSGSFDFFKECSRLDMMESYQELHGLIEEYKKLLDEIRTDTCSLGSDRELSVTKKKSLNIKITQNRKKLDETGRKIKEYNLNVHEYADNSKYLPDEYELLGAYISSHPLDAYKELYKTSNVTCISDFEEGKKTYIGMIRNIRRTKRKKDGAAMAFFDLEDISGTISVNCFTAEFKKYHALIEDGNVVRIYAEGKIEDGFRDDEEPVNKITVISMEKCLPYRTPVFVSIPNHSFERYAYETLLPYEDDNGHPVWLHTCNDGQVSVKKMYVSRKVAYMFFDDMQTFILNF